LWMARCYAGAVMVEGTTLSEGRGTTRPLELLGAPDLDVAALLAQMRALAPAWLRGCLLRPCWFEPMFHKHAGKLCAGFQVHVEDAAYYDHEAFRPWRLFALAFKALRRLRPDYPLWREFPFEDARSGLAIDVITGGDTTLCLGGEAAARICGGAGWMTRPRLPPTWTRWRARTNPPGVWNVSRRCCTEGQRATFSAPGRVGRPSPDPWRRCRRCWRHIAETGSAIVRQWLRAPAPRQRYPATRRHRPL